MRPASHIPLAAIMMKLGSGRLLLLDGFGNRICRAPRGPLERFPVLDLPARFAKMALAFVASGESMKTEWRESSRLHRPIRSTSSSCVRSTANDGMSRHRSAWRQTAPPPAAGQDASPGRRRRGRYRRRWTGRSRNRSPAELPDRTGGAGGRARCLRKEQAQRPIGTSRRNLHLDRSGAEKVAAFQNCTKTGRNNRPFLVGDGSERRQARSRPRPCRWPRPRASLVVRCAG